MNPRPSPTASLSRLESIVLHTIRPPLPQVGGAPHLISSCAARFRAASSRAAAAAWTRRRTATTPRRPACLERRAAANSRRARARAGATPAPIRREPRQGVAVYVPRPYLTNSFRVGGLPLTRTRASLSGLTSVGSPSTLKERGPKRSTRTETITVKKPTKYMPPPMTTPTAADSHSEAAVVRPCTSCSCVGVQR
jgi:hypothetical protein